MTVAKITINKKGSKYDVELDYHDKTAQAGDIIQVLAAFLNTFADEYAEQLSAKYGRPADLYKSEVLKHLQK